MSKVKRKTEILDAVQFVDGRIGESIDFCDTLMPEFSLVATKQDGVVGPRSRICHGASLDGKPVQVGDWIVKDAAGKSAIYSNEEYVAEFEAHT